MKISRILFLFLGFLCVVVTSEGEPGKPLKFGVVQYDPSQTLDGYNFYTDYVHSAYLMDMKGRTVYRWEFFHSGAWVYARLLSDGGIIALSTGEWLVRFDKNSNVVWKLPLAVNHDIETLPDGSFLVPVWEALIQYNGRMVRFDSIVHVSKDGRALDSWSTFAHLKELQRFHPPSFLDSQPDQKQKHKITPRYMGSLDANLLDPKNNIYFFRYYHLNSIQVLPETPLGLRDKRFQKGNWLICLRDVDLMVIVDKDTHQPVWGWGPGELDRPHMPRMVSSGNILVFDNGLHRTYSRLLMVEPVSGKIVWQYKAAPPERFHSGVEGSGQLLPNGNFLICESTKGRVFEITPAGKIVWKFLNPEFSSNGHRLGIYRFERIPKEKLPAGLLPQVNLLGK